MARGSNFRYIIPVLALTILGETCFAFSFEDTEFKGDLRLRYQYDHLSEVQTSTQRHRARGRLRFGFETALNDRVSVGIRMASGQTDNRSTNQTLGDFFVTKDIRLDMAYAAWQATEEVGLVLGKYRNAFLVVDDLIWDGDINFEGASALWKRPPAGGIGGLANAGFLVLKEEKSSSEDQYVFYVQPGVSFSAAGDFTGEFGIAFYGFENVKGSVPDGDLSSGTNTLVDGRLKYDYDSLSPNLVLAYRVGGEDGPPYTLTFIGDYVYSFDSKDSGFLAGFRFGHAKVKTGNSWSAYYNYRRLERDAFMDVFPDSDFYCGSTGVSGHEVIFEYAVARSVILGLDYYRARKLEGDEDPLDTLQLDCVFKF
jgi:hypothetical protein